MKNSKTESKAMKLLPLTIALFAGGIAALLSWTPPPTNAPIVPVLPVPPVPPVPTTKPTNTPTPKPTQTSTPVPAKVSGTFVGNTVNNQFGSVQVQVSIIDNTITDVTALKYPTGGGSSQISQQAIPELVQQVLLAQSSNINGVSGASYTSQSFYDSLYSALTKAGL